MRTASPAFLAACKDGHVRPFLAVMLDYPAGPVRCTTLPFPVTWGGQEWTAVGALGAVSGVSEAADAESRAVTVTLSGVPGAWYDYLRGQHVQGRDAEIFLGLMGPKYELLGDPVSIWAGRMDTQDVTVGEATSVAVTCESLIYDWRRPRVLRWTAIDQQRLHAGDKGFDYVTAVADMEITWGRG